VVQDDPSLKRTGAGRQPHHMVSPTDGWLCRYAGLRAAVALLGVSDRAMRAVMRLPTGSYSMNRLR
jgi:hypothetical protein